MEKITLQPKDGVSEMIIREGTALEIKPPQPVEFKGTFDGVIEWWKNRSVGAKRSFVSNSRLEYSKNDMTIKLYVDENNHYQDKLTGIIKMNKDLEEFGINKDKQWTIEAFSKYIRLKKYLFADKDSHAVLLSRLNSFKANVEAELINEKDNRGNAKVSAQRSIKTDLPEKFSLLLAPYVGYEKIQFDVELCVDGSSSGVVIWLLSNEMVESLQKLQDSIFEKTLPQFAGIPVMEY
jgi:hypothetical protein